MKIRILTTLVLSFWGISSLFAQDSLTKTKNRLAFVFKLDNRFSFAGSQFLTIYGFRTGIKLNNKHELGIAFNWVGSRNTFDIVLPPQPNQPTLEPEMAEGVFFYKYAGIFYEYNFFQRNRWLMSIPLQIGGGKAGVKIYTAQDRVFLERRQANFFLFEPAYNVEYKLIRYVGIGGGVGYRFAFSEQKIVNENLTRPVFIVRLKLYLGEIYRGIRGK